MVADDIQESLLDSILNTLYKLFGVDTVSTASKSLQSLDAMFTNNGVKAEALSQIRDALALCDSGKQRAEMLNRFSDVLNLSSDLKKILINELNTYVIHDEDHFLFDLDGDNQIINVINFDNISFAHMDTVPLLDQAAYIKKYMGTWLKDNGDVLSEQSLAKFKRSAGAAYHPDKNPTVDKKILSNLNSFVDYYKSNPNELTGLNEMLAKIK